MGRRLALHLLAAWALFMGAMTGLWFVAQSEPSLWGTLLLANCMIFGCGGSGFMFLRGFRLL